MQMQQYQQSQKPSRTVLPRYSDLPPDHDSMANLPGFVDVLNTLELP